MFPIYDMIHVDLFVDRCVLFDLHSLFLHDLMHIWSLHNFGQVVDLGNRFA